jgi:hypothetical protein
MSKKIKPLSKKLKAAEKIMNIYSYKGRRSLTAPETEKRNVSSVIYMVVSKFNNFVKVLTKKPFFDFVNFLKNEVDHDFFISLKLIDAVKVEKLLDTAFSKWVDYGFNKGSEPDKEFAMLKEIFDAWLELKKEVISNKRNLVSLVEAFMVWHINLLESDKGKASGLISMI